MKHPVQNLGAIVIVVAFGLLTAACGSSSHSTLPHPPAPAPTPTTQTTTPTTAALSKGVTVTDSNDFRWNVQLGAPSEVTQFNYGGLSPFEVIAPPNQYYVKVPVVATNLQSDRSAMLDGLVAPKGNDNVDPAVPAAALPKGACQTTDSDQFQSPDGLCLISPGLEPGVATDISSDLILPDGTGLGTGESPLQLPNIPASGTAHMTLYFGPVSAHFDTAHLEVMFGIGGGPKMVAVSGAA